METHQAVECAQARATGAAKQVALKAREMVEP